MRDCIYLNLILYQGKGNFHDHFDIEHISFHFLRFWNENSLQKSLHMGGGKDNNYCYLSRGFLKCGQPLILFCFV